MTRHCKHAKKSTRPCSNNQARVSLCCQTSHGVVLIVLTQTMPVHQACILWWCCPHAAPTNNVDLCVMHDEVKGMLVFFGCSVGSCHFNILLGLLLPNLAGVRHSKAKGLLVLFRCSVGSCHVCPCSNHITCGGAVLMVLSQTVLLLVSFMLRPKPCWFSLDMQCWVSRCNTCKMKQLPCSVDNCAAKPVIMLSSLCPPKKCCCWCHAWQG
jgi:hypothetical protein